MEAALSTTAAVLQALRGGPRYGRDLIRAIGAQADGIVNPRPGTLYRALASLARQGLVRTWTVTPGGRRGARARRYYELTPKGTVTTEQQRTAFGRLLGLLPARPAEQSARLMAERLRRTMELSQFAIKLRTGVRASLARP